MPEAEPHVLQSTQLPAASRKQKMAPTPSIALPRTQVHAHHFGFNVQVLSHSPRLATFPGVLHSGSHAPPPLHPVPAPQALRSQTPSISHPALSAGHRHSWAWLITPAGRGAEADRASSISRSKSVHWPECLARRLITSCLALEHGVSIIKAG